MTEREERNINALNIKKALIDRKYNGAIQIVTTEADVLGARPSTIYAIPTAVRGNVKTFATPLREVRLDKDASGNVVQTIIEPPAEALKNSLTNVLREAAMRMTGKAAIADEHRTSTETARAIGLVQSSERKAGREEVVEKPVEKAVTQAPQMPRMPDTPIFASQPPPRNPPAPQMMGRAVHKPEDVADKARALVLGLLGR